MKKLAWILFFCIGLLLAAAAIVHVSGRPRTLADVSSPAGTWRLVVRGQNKLIGGVEVTAAVHTSDGRRISLGVIDLRSNWAEAKHEYQPHDRLHTRIDEVKAVVGGRLLLRDRYFAGEDYVVAGKMGLEDVRLPIGEVNSLGFRLASGLSASDDHVDLRIVDFDRLLHPGRTFTVSADLAKTGTDLMHLQYAWHDSTTDRSLTGSLVDGFSVSLQVEEVTNHVVIGTVEVQAKEPLIRLSGRFRLVNRIGSAR